VKIQYIVLHVELLKKNVSYVINIFFKYLLSLMIINTAIDLSDCDLKISRRLQKKQNCYNYFFNPTLDITLRNAKVFYVDPNNKFIVFIFSKVVNINLYLFCKSISDNLLFKTKQLAKRIMYSSTIHEKEAFPFYLVRENNEEFTIKCNVNNNIKSYFNNKLEKFKIPINGINYNSITLNIKNIWEDPARVGFNLDIKQLNQEIL
jgi:hypothetical protein